MYARFNWFSLKTQISVCCTRCLFSHQQIGIETKEHFFPKYIAEEVLYQHPQCIFVHKKEMSRLEDKGDTVSCEHKGSNSSPEKSQTRIFDLSLEIT